MAKISGLSFLFQSWCIIAISLLLHLCNEGACAFSFSSARSTRLSAPYSVCSPGTSLRQSAKVPSSLLSASAQEDTESTTNDLTTTSFVEDQDEIVVEVVAEPITSSTTPTTTEAQKAKPSVSPSSPIDAISSLVFGNSKNNDRASVEYQKGLITIGFITLLFSSNSPVLHAAFTATTTDSVSGVVASAAPPVLLLNAAVSAVALVGLLLGGSTLEQNTDLPSTLKTNEATPEDLLGGGVQEPQENYLEQQPTKQQRGIIASLLGSDGNSQLELGLQGGMELGLWKFLGTTANIYGLSLTTAAHGAFLIQLTTLIVPVVQGIMGVPIPKRIQFSVVLALAGVICFTQDPTGTPSLTGDLLCVVAAAFYATYDLRLFSWGKQVAPRRLITGKIATQALLSLGLLFSAGSTSGLLGGTSTAAGQAVSDLSAWQETLQYISNNPQWTVLIPVVLWSGVAVNAIAPFLQVGGQQAVGPTRCQTIYASQPLWAAIISFLVFGETIGWQGFVGGSAFLTALFLAANAEPPEADCGKSQCEV